MASANGSSPPNPTEQVVALYEQMESQAAKAGETLVGSRGFAGLLGQLAENTAAVTRLGTDAMDLVLRNLRVAGRRDVVRLARQLARTEDKLERVLQEVESLRDELARRDDRPDSRASAPTTPGKGSDQGNGSAGGRRGAGAGAGGRSGRGRAAAAADAVEAAATAAEKR